MECSSNIRSNLLTSIPVPPKMPEGNEWNPESKSFHGYNAFYSVCRNWALHLSGKNKTTVYQAYKQIDQLIETNLGQIADISERKREFLIALNQKNWESPLFLKSDEYPWIALSLLRTGDLTIEQFTTLMFYRMTAESNQKVRSLPLFIRNADPTQPPQVNPKARDLIKRTLEPVRHHLEIEIPETPFDTTNPHLTEKQLDEFFDRMSMKPESEQQFFYVDDTQGEVSANPQEIAAQLFSQTRTISQEIKDSVGINVFNRFNLYPPSGSGLPVKRMRMIPSLSMMQTFLDVKFPHPVKINPMICLSPIDAIRKNACTRTRELAITFPKIRLPKTADNLLAPDFDFPYHDFYHSIIASAVPDDHIHASLIIDNILNRYKSDPDYASIKDIIEEFQERVVDMERPFYRQDSHALKEFGDNMSALFWASLSFDLFSAQNRLQLQHKIKHPEAIIGMKFVENITRLATTQFFEEFFWDIITEKNSFDAFNIDIASFALASAIEERRIRRLLPQVPGASRYAFNQEDDFQKAKVYNMFQRWQGVLEALRKK